MSFDYKSPDFEQHMYYVAKARELRAQFWQNVFTGILNGPASIAGRFAAIMDKLSGGKRVAS